MRRDALSLLLLLMLACRSADQAVAPEPVPAPAPVASVDSRDAILAASNLPELVPTPLAHDPAQATVSRLSNGMTVYIATDRSTPRFSAWITVRSGSRNDPANSTGLAHYLEHMLFKGTRQLGTLDFAAEAPHLLRIEELYRQLRGQTDPAARQAIFAQIDEATQKTAATAIPNEFDNLYASMGITGVNAFTGEDMTTYIADVPSNRLEQWARVEGDRFTDPVFRLFFIELEAVYEEKNRSLDNPDVRVSEALSQGVFPQHPYGTQQTIGTVEHLKTPAYDDMAAFFARWYVPNNMAIVLSGDIDAATALPVLERYFGQWQPQGLVAPQAATLPPLPGRQFAQIHARGEQSVTVAWPTVAAGHPDEPALRVMDMLVDNASTGILNVDVLLPQKLPAAGSHHSFMTEAGYWTLEGTAKEGQSLDDVERLLMDVIAKLKSGQVSQPEIDAVVLDFEIQTKRRMESNDGRVYAMMDAFINRQSWEKVSRELDDLRRVKREDVLRVATQYLGEGRMVVHRTRGEYVPPQLDKPSITPIEVDPSRHSAAYREILSMPTPPLEPKWLVQGQDYQRLDTASGSLIATKNTRNDLWSATLVYDVGSRRRPLLCYAAELADQSGAGEQDAATFRRALYALGTSIHVSCDADRTSISVSGIDRHLEASMDLVRQWVESPKPADDLLTGLLENTLTQRRAAIDEPRALASALASYAMYDKRSPYLNVPSNKDLARAKSNRLVREFSDLAKLEHQTLYFGPRDAAAVAEQLQVGAGKRDVKPIDPIRYRRVRNDVVYFLHKPTAQSQITVLFPQSPQAREDRPIASVLNEYLGGSMSGLIFQEMREARGLAYSAGAWYSGGRRLGDDSGLVGRIGTQVDKTPEALAVMLELLRMPAQPDRVQAARAQLDEAYRADRIEPRSIGSAVHSWDERGEDADPRPWEREQARLVDKAQLDQLITKVGGSSVIVAILGDRDRIDLERIKQHAKLVEVKVDDVFAFGAFPTSDGGAGASAPSP